MTGQLQAAVQRSSMIQSCNVFVCMARFVLFCFPTRMSLSNFVVASDSASCLPSPLYRSPMCRVRRHCGADISSWYPGIPLLPIALDGRTLADQGCFMTPPQLGLYVRRMFSSPMGMCTSTHFFGFLYRNRRSRSYCPPRRLRIRC